MDPAGTAPASETTLLSFIQPYGYYGSARAPSCAPPPVGFEGNHQQPLALVSRVPRYPGLNCLRSGRDRGRETSEEVHNLATQTRQEILFGIFKLGLWYTSLPSWWLSTSLHCPVEIYFGPVKVRGVTTLLPAFPLSVLPGRSSVALFTIRTTTVRFVACVRVEARLV